MAGPDVSAPRGYSFGQFRIDVTTYELRRDGDLIAISPKAFDALLMLVRNKDRAVSKDELMDSVWPDANVTEDSLTQCISTLRRALGDDSNHPKFIATVARRGYRFIAAAEPLLPPPVAAPEVAAPEEVPFAAPIEERAQPRPRSNRLLWIAAMLGGVLIGAGAVALLESRPAPADAAHATDPAKLRFVVDAPEGIAFGSGAVVSPNGHYLAFAAEDDRTGTVRLWLKSLDSAEARALSGTEGASRPFWSPDSRFLGFFADGKLKRVGLDNGPPLVVATLGTYSAGGAWGKNGVILFADQRSGIYSVPDSGGAPTAVTSLDPSTQEVAHRWPQFLPDGEHFLFFRTSAHADQGGTYVGSLHSHNTTRLLGAIAVYAPPGYLLYVRDRVLTAQGFDAATLKLSGSSSVVDGSVLTAGNANEAGVSVSDNGLLIFGGSPTRERPIWFDRSGRQIAAFDVPAAVHNPALSPDQKQLLVGSREVEHGLWMLDLDRDAPTRFVPDGMRPQWSPDGSKIAYTADRISNVGDIFMKSVGGNGDELLFRSKENKMVDDWSPDGASIVYASINPQTKTDLWILPVSGDRKPRLFLQTPADELQGQISPDGHWIAYTSDESGVWEVYLQSFPEPGAKRTISIGGGTEPHWRHDGRELFYLSADRTLMSVNVTLGASVTIGRPRPLFRAAIPSSFTVFRNHYAVSADGQKFIICAVEHKGKEELVTVLANWDPQAKR